MEEYCSASFAKNPFYNNSLFDGKAGYCAVIGLKTFVINGETKNG